MTKKRSNAISCRNSWSLSCVAHTESVLIFSDSRNLSVSSSSSWLLSQSVPWTERNVSPRRCRRTEWPVALNPYHFYVSALGTRETCARTRRSARWPCTSHLKCEQRKSNSFVQIDLVRFYVDHPFSYKRRATLVATMNYVARRMFTCIRNNSDD